MNQFTLSSNLRNIFIGMMIIGALCLGLAWMDGANFHARFWSNLLHNSVFFTGVAIMATFFICASITAYAGWYTAFKRVFEAVSSFLLPGFILMTVIGIVVYMHGNHLYHWADSASVEGDKILTGKSSFLNKNWYLFGTLIIGAVYVYLGHKLRSLSHQEDAEQPDPNFSIHRESRKYAAIFLPIFGFTSVALLWQWVMSLDAHWYSTMFAWYCLASLFVSMVSIMALIMLYLRSIGYYQNLSKHHLHDIGKLIFGISVFWTYLWFSQFMLIWYANIGEETIYFKERYDKYPVLFFGNIVINFALPFLVLIRNDNKWKTGSLGFMSVLILIGHWLDFFLMIKPGVLHTAHELGGHASHGAVGDTGHAADHAATAASHGAAEVANAAHGAGIHAAEHASSMVSGFTFPGLIEVGTFLGFLGFFGYWVFNTLSKGNLHAANDPYIEESLHHHV